jgi:hypothetical protein
VAQGENKGGGSAKEKKRKEKKKIDRGGDNDLDPQACVSQWNTPVTSVNRQAGKRLRLGLTLTEGPKSNPNQGTKIYRNLSHEWLHRCKIHTSTPMQAATQGDK